MKKNMQGFTLIELMIVVAIIAILAAIAISQYQDYVIRSQVSEGSALADGMKTALVEYYQNKGVWPTANEDAGLAAATGIQGNYVSQGNVATNPGTIQMTFGNDAHTKLTTANAVLIFSAVTHEGSVEWNCLSSTIDQKWLASSCEDRAPSFNNS
jgi:type IV pilus assembly protein PilA